MNKEVDSDIIMVIPAEFREEIAEIISVGIQRTKLDPLIRKEISNWWNAELSLMNETFGE